MKIAVAGHICADLTPQLPLGVGMSPGHLYDVGALAIRPGGCIVNVGRVLLSLGHQARLMGVVGDDDLGAISLREMDVEGLDTAHMRTVTDTGTSFSVVIEPPGMNRSFWHHVGANSRFDDVNLDLDGLDLLHVGYPSLLPHMMMNGGASLIALMKRAKDLGITTSLDLAVVDRTSSAGAVDWHDLMSRLLEFVDIICPSVDDLTSALEVGPVSTKHEVVEMSARLHKLGAGIVMITAGEDGLHISTGNQERLANGGRALTPIAQTWANSQSWAPARERGPVITTNGAGDAAAAGLIAGIASGLGVREAAGLASLSAADWIQGHPGASLSSHDAVAH